MSVYVLKKGHRYCVAAKIVERLTLFTVHNRVKSGAATDLNKRRDLHNNYETSIVRPRFQLALYLHDSHFLMCILSAVQKTRKIFYPCYWKTCVFGDVLESHDESGDVFILA